MFTIKCNNSDQETRAWHSGKKIQKGHRVLSWVSRGDFTEEGTAKLRPEGRVTDSQDTMS